MNLQHIQTLLESMGSRKLDSLAVELSRLVGVTSDQFKSLLDLITQNQSSLRVLHITHDTRLTLPHPNPDQNISFTDIPPMVNKFPNIVQLCFVSSNYAIDLNDDDLRAMALAWRSLRVFQIRCTRPYSPRPSITLQSLLDEYDASSLSVAMKYRLILLFHTDGIPMCLTKRSLAMSL